MRIADLLVHWLENDAVVRDCTTKSAKISEYLVPTVNARYRLATESDQDPTAVVIWIPPGAEVTETQLQTVVPQIVFSDSVGTLLSGGWLDELNRRGMRIAEISPVSHRTAKLAFWLETTAALPKQLAALNNEGMIARLEQREALAELSRVRRQLAAKEDQSREAEARRDRELAELAQRLRAIGSRCEQLEHELEKTRLRLRQAERREAQVFSDVKELLSKLNRDGRQRIHALETELQKARHELAQTARARVDAHNEAASLEASLSYRLGHAAVLAVKNPREELVKAPGRLARAWRSRNDQPVGLLPKPNLPREPRGNPTPDDREIETQDAIAREMFRDREPFLGPRAIAAVCGSYMAKELQAAATVRVLRPGAWRYALEDDAPAFVLVTSDAFGSVEGWARVGIDGVHGGRHRLEELAEWCNTAGVPVVYWHVSEVDSPTIGTLRRGRYDLRFGASLRSADLLGGNLLPISVSPRLWYRDMGRARKGAFALAPAKPKIDPSTLEAARQLEREDILVDPLAAMFEPLARWPGVLARIVPGNARTLESALATRERYVEVHRAAPSSTELRALLSGCSLVGGKLGDSLSGDRHVDLAEKLGGQSLGQRLLVMARALGRTIEVADTEKLTVCVPVVAEGALESLVSELVDEPLPTETRLQLQGAPAVPEALAHFDVEAMPAPTRVPRLSLRSSTRYVAQLRNAKVFSAARRHLWEHVLEPAAVVVRDVDGVAAVLVDSNAPISIGLELDDVSLEFGSSFVHEYNLENAPDPSTRKSS